jgi:hypothetical protein
MTTATVQAQPTAADIRAMVHDREAYGFSGEASPQDDTEPKLVAGNDHVNWPHRDHQNWPHLRPIS